MKSSINRRNLLRAGAATAAAPAFLRAAAKEPRSIIFMVSDGMSAGVLPLAEAFSRLARGKGTVWTDLLAKPGVARGFQDMASLNAMVTDSAAASSSWGSGSRVFNAAINVLPDGTKLTPIGWLARDKGRRVGLVTTATVTHATPAGFASVSPKRDDEDGIASQYLDKVDVALGGGKRFFSAERRRDKKDLLAAFRQAGYQVSLTKSELKPSAGAKLLGLYSESHVPYTIDQRASSDLQRDVPTLAEMTEAALQSLDSGRNGFLLQIEGARIDHAAHSNDAAGLLWDQIAFDDAIAAVLRYCERRPDTLVVITSDHGNANPGLSGMGREYDDTNSCFARLLKASASYDVLSKKLGNPTGYSGITIQTQASAAPKTDLVKQAILSTMGFEISDLDAVAIQTSLARSQPLSLNKQLDNIQGVLGQVLGNYTGMGWVSTSHTADYTFVTALGPGSEDFQGLIRNVDVFTKLTKRMGISHKNPAMDPAKARSLAASAPRRERPDWA
jgi:alkaline phosphatase